MPISRFRRVGAPPTARAATRALRARAIMVIAVAAIFGASLLASGAANAASAGGGRGGASASLAPGGPAGATSGKAAAQQCFFIFPDCTSTDPTANFGLVSNGDTSSCSFEYTTDWGDGKTDVQSFPGGPDGATLAKFSHTYDKSKPQTWTITVTGLVTAGTTCTANGGTLLFTLLPDLGAAAVRFAADSGLTPTTPGLPVVKDDSEKLVGRDDQGPDSCNGVAQPKTFDYLDCGTPVPTGAKAKDWPVIYAEGDSLTLNQVIFAENGQVPDPQLTATATVSGQGSASLTLAATPLSQAKAGDGYQLTGSDLPFAGTLPSVPGRDTLTIQWTVTDVDSGVVVKSVTTSHAIYVTGGKYVNQGLPSGENLPFETALDVGTVAAAGQTNAKSVFHAIWKKFTSLSIEHPELNPATGEIKYGKGLEYYHDGFGTISAGFNGDRLGCINVRGLILSGSGHCLAWAEFLALVLAYQGIPARVHGLAGAEGFEPGPSADGCSASECAYMLVGKGLWKFAHASAAGKYSYRDKLAVTGSGAIEISGSEVTYKSAGPQAQGPVDTPPPFFTDGDHAIDEVTLPSGNVWVDPSYGDPRPPTAPFPDVRSYEPNALAGFAVILKKNGRKLDPLKADYDKSAIAAECRHATCYFQAFKGI